MNKDGSAEKRSRWFDEGASALRLVLDRQGRREQLPPTGDYYACPCCLRLFTRAAVTARVLTLEDVPPKALGGRPMLLTCAECNNSAGTNFDAHAATKAAADAFVRGTASDRKVPMTAYINGSPMRGTAQSTDSGISLVGVPKQNNPKAQASYEKALDSLTQGSSSSTGFSFTIHTRFDEPRARLSLIRAAYLAAFAALGWSYILRPVLQPIRDQLRNPGTQALETYMFRDQDASNTSRRILLVDEPSELRCIVIMLGEYSVFLPGLFNTRTWDETSAAFSSRRGKDDRLNVTLRGKEMPWPKWPTYFLDPPAVI
jgi:hypothetical protein